jgi:signal transduction histidine kinase
VADIALAGLDRGIDLEVDAPDALVVAGVDLALGVLVRNLVDNALRYTPPGGRVRVSLAGEGVVVRLRVEDSGPGIPPDERAAALARFHRGLGHAASGSGLGLSIVQRIVERHGGGLALDEAPGLGGLRVDVRLPALRAA